MSSKEGIVDFGDLLSDTEWATAVRETKLGEPTIRIMQNAIDWHAVSQYQI